MLSLIQLLAQTAANAPVVAETAATEQKHLIYLVMEADPVVQLTLVILFLFSIVSWAIIFAKHSQIKRFTRLIGGFADFFWSAKNSEEVSLKRGAHKGPGFRLYQAATKSGNGDRREREVRRAYESEIETIETGVPFLAMTASAAPFIGLFGTVWGILNAFWKIGQSGTSSLATVGPHIAEALIATAIGLAAAIPALIFYNVFVGKIRRYSKTLDDFSNDLMHRLETEK